MGGGLPFAFVIPAEAGIHRRGGADRASALSVWIPAFAGMTGVGRGAYSRGLVAFVDPGVRRDDGLAEARL